MTFVLELYVRFELGSFGADSAKPLLGFSNDRDFLSKLFRPALKRLSRKVVALVSKKRRADGTLAVTGLKNLKSSQLASQFLHHMIHLQVACKSVNINAFLCCLALRQLITALYV